jgi:hypothetical protein
MTKPLTEKRVREIMTATDLVTGAQVREIVRKEIEGELTATVNDSLMAEAMKSNEPRIKEICREIVAETIESRVRTIVDDALLRNGIQPDKSHDAKGKD